MGDVAQILAGTMSSQQRTSNASASLGPPPPPPPSHHPSRAMKMTGMSREVMELLSGRQDKRSAALPPIVPSFPPSGKSSPVPGDSTKEAGSGTVKVGNRLILSDKPVRKWVWAPFASSARTDGAMFRHWVRASVEYPYYPYARFDIHLDPVTYTEEEYRQFLQSPTWTKSETDRLMDLARKYELRWAVIYDGWLDACQTPGRKIEDLQHRYYSVAAILTQSRVAKEAAAEVASLSSSAPAALADTEQAKAAAENLVMETAAARSIATAEPNHQPLITTIGSGTTNKNVFDLNKERQRRAHLELIWNRTKEEELEEAELRKELRLVEAQIRKLKKSGGHILAASSGVGGSSRNASRSVTPVPTAAAGHASAAAAMSDSDLLDQCFASTAPTPMPQTPYLQSGRLVPPATGGPVGLNKTTLKRMDDVLEELKIPKRPMPTKRVCDLYDSVRKDALTLLTLQKMVLQKEGQLQSKRLKLAKLGGGVRVVDEETLLGIAPVAAASTASVSTSGGTGRSKTGSGKSKAPRGSGRSKGGGTKSDGGAADQKGASKKGSTKRKKKSDGKSASGAAAAAATAAGQASMAGAKGGDDEAKPAKKRARKS